MLKKRELLRSRQNPTVKQICALSDKKHRRESGLFRFDGVKLLSEALTERLDVRMVAVREDALPALEAILEAAQNEGILSDDAVIPVSAEVFEKISEERSPEGVITVAAQKRDTHRELSAEDCRSYPASEERLLIAEALRDPGNLGTVIRSCAALGIDRLIISDDCADIYNSKTIRGAMGGLFRLKIDVAPAGSLPDLIRALSANGRRVYATALHSDAEMIGEITLRLGDCFVIGNEGHGLSKGAIDACDGCAIIPMREGSESLNAAAAAAICIWETVRAK